MKNQNKAWALGAAVLALSAGPVVTAHAQDQQPRPSNQRPMHAFSGGEAPWITIALRHKTELNLSADQVSNLEKIRTNFANQAKPIGDQVRTLEADLHNILQQSPANLVLARTKIDQAEKLRADLRYLRVEALENGKSVLSTQQRDQLKSLFAARQHGPRGNQKQAS